MCRSESTTIRLGLRSALQTPAVQGRFSVVYWYWKQPAAASDTMTFGELTIDTASHTVRVSGEEVALTPKEFDLLVFLASNKGIALSREKILQKVWNYYYFGEDRTVDTHVKMLRGHLGKCRSYIATVWGIGYKFDPDATR